MRIEELEGRSQESEGRSQEWNQSAGVIFQATLSVGNEAAICGSHFELHNPAVHRGWMRDFFPIGAQKVQMLLPPNRRVGRVELLRVRAPDRTIEFTVPGVVGYEIAAIHAA